MALLAGQAGRASRRIASTTRVRTLLACAAVAIKLAGAASSRTTCRNPGVHLAAAYIAHIAPTAACGRNGRRISSFSGRHPGASGRSPFRKSGARYPRHQRSTSRTWYRSSGGTKNRCRPAPMGPLRTKSRLLRRGSGDAAFTGDAARCPERSQGSGSASPVRETDFACLTPTPLMYS